VLPVYLSSTCVLLTIEESAGLAKFALREGVVERGKRFLACSCEHKSQIHRVACGVPTCCDSWDDNTLAWAVLVISWHGVIRSAATHDYVLDI
jgi:hypothetical protein